MTVRLSLAALICAFLVPIAGPAAGAPKNRVEAGPPVMRIPKMRKAPNNTTL